MPAVTDVELQQILGEPRKELSFSVWGREK